MILDFFKKIKSSQLVPAAMLNPDEFEKVKKNAAKYIADKIISMEDIEGVKIFAAESDDVSFLQYLVNFKLPIESKDDFDKEKFIDDIIYVALMQNKNWKTNNVEDIIWTDAASRYDDWDSQAEDFIDRVLAGGKLALIEKMHEDFWEKLAEMMAEDENLTKRVESMVAMNGDVGQIDFLISILDYFAKNMGKKINFNFDVLEESLKKFIINGNFGDYDIGAEEIFISKKYTELFNINEIKRAFIQSGDAGQISLMIDTIAEEEREDLTFTTKEMKKICEIAENSKNASLILSYVKLDSNADTKKLYDILLTARDEKEKSIKENTKRAKILNLPKSKNQEESVEVFTTSNDDDIYDENTELESINDAILYFEQNYSEQLDTDIHQ